MALARIITAAAISLTIITTGLHAGAFDPRVKEGDKELKKKRQEWIDAMHNCEPGVNWKLIDGQTRASRQAMKIGSLADLPDKGRKNRTAGNTEVIANGKIKGTWIEKGSNNQAGRVMTADIDFDRNLIYLISQGGNIWRGTLEGKNWACLNNLQQFDGSFIRLINTGKAVKRVIIADNNSVFYTDDEGATWIETKGTDNIKKWGSIKRMIVLNNNVSTMYLISNEWDYQNWRAISAIYQSTDKGESFTKIKIYGKSENLLDMWAPRYDSDIAYYLSRDTLFTLDADGISQEFTLCNWQASGGSLSGVQSFMLQGSSYDGRTSLNLAMIANSSPKANFYISMDKGASWSKTGTLDESPFTRNSFRVSSVDEGTMFFGNVELSVTSSKGSSWKVMNKWGEYYSDVKNKLHADIPSIDIFRTPDSVEIALVSTDGGLYITDENFAKVSNLSLEGLNVSQYYDVLTSEIKPDVVFAGAQDQGFQRCLRDSGSTLGFSQIISGDYGHLTSGDGGYTLWSVYPGFAHVYTNATGQETRYSWDFAGEGWLWMPHIIAGPGSSKTAYIAAGGATSQESNLWELTLNSNNITHKKYDFDFIKASNGGKLATIGISTINTKVFYAITTNGKFFSSTDSGINWKMSENFTGPGNHYFYGSAILPSAKQAGRLFVAGSGYNSDSHPVYVSNDNGITFMPADSGLPKTLVYGLAQSSDEKLLFAATEVGPYVYIVEDSVWHDLSGYSAPDQTYWSVEFVPSKNSARFGTYGRGIWDFRIDELKLGVNDGKADIVPGLTIGASPVPFDGIVSIAAGTDRAVNAVIRIFDLEGRVVNTLFAGEMAAGTTKYSWDGRSSDGYEAPAGNYIAVLSAGGNTSFVKIVKQ